MLLAEQLHEYLIRTGQTREEFASAMGVNASLLSRLIPSNGGPPVREPKLSTMKRVAAASGGAITLEDFCRMGAFLPEDSDRKRRRYVTRSLKLAMQAMASGKRSRKTKKGKKP
jgi:transcriptional regulator with XRE-family HTH domain